MGGCSDQSKVTVSDDNIKGKQAGKEEGRERDTPGTLLWKLL